MVRRLRRRHGESAVRRPSQRRRRGVQHRDAHPLRRIHSAEGIAAGEPGRRDAARRHRLRLRSGSTTAALARGATRRGAGCARGCTGAGIQAHAHG
eukprot:3263386-Pleurochrysis_carterae.AAC.1